MSSDREAFMQAILDAPDDDTPRLIFADWLDEHGEAERAEFIRVQCELAKHPGMNCGVMYCSERDAGGLCDSCTRYKALRRREAELFKSLGANPCMPRRTVFSRDAAGRISGATTYP